MTKNIDPKAHPVGRGDHQTEEPNLVTAQFHYSGPLPPPVILRQYEEALPGTAHRILTMAEEQSKHRKEMEKITLRNGYIQEMIGKALSFIMLAIIMIGCMFLVYNDKPLDALGVLLTTAAVYLGFLFLNRQVPKDH